MDFLQALDTRLYLALATSGNLAAGIFGLFFAAFATAGLGWWAIALLGVRARGPGRRGLRIAFATAVGGIAAAQVAEWLKLYVQRPRPFSALQVDALSQPSSFSFPSGDASLGFGAATGLWLTWPAARFPALLVAISIGFSRVVVGAHYPSDVLGGAVVGCACGIAAERLWALLLRRFWRVYVVADPSGATTVREKGGHSSIGPWYALGDLLVVSGESIVRDLQEGLRAAGSAGGRASRVLYGGDPHGHPAQLPQVLRGFGYEDFVFARGMGDDAGSLGSVFWWQAPSGDRVRATHLTAELASALPLSEGGAASGGKRTAGRMTLRRRVRRMGIVDHALAYADQSALLVMTGDGRLGGHPRLALTAENVRDEGPLGVPGQRDVLVEVVAALRSTGLDARPAADLEEYTAALGAPRSTHAGELVAGRHQPIQSGASSARAWRKQEGASCERLLVERCEPLDALTGGLARDELSALWRALLPALADQAPEPEGLDDWAAEAEIADRFARVRSGGEALAERLAQELAGPGGAPVVWNFRPARRRVVTDIAGIPRTVECAALGVAPLTPLGSTEAALSSPEEGVLENARYRVEVDLDGSFVVIDRRSRVRSGRLNVLVDEGDRGDLSTHAFAGPLVSARGMSGERRTEIRGDRGSVTVDLALRLPEGLRDDRLVRAPVTVLCPTRVTITLDAPARYVAVAIAVDNQARDHRLRALCETGTRSLTHRADGAFGTTVRPVRIPSGRGWRERPNGDHATTGLVTVSGTSRGLTLGLDGPREYGIRADGTQIAITLVRAVGWLSRGDLRERPGHVGPPLEVPSAQCRGPRTYRYVAVPFGAPAELAVAEGDARDALSPVVVSRGAGPERSFALVVGGGAVELSALRAGPRPGTVVVRLVNRSAAPASAVVSLGGREIVAARAVDLREGEILLASGREVIRTAAPPTFGDGGMSVDLAPHEIGTYLVTLLP